MAIDLNTKQHNVINEPIIDWSRSVMERIALAPLHVLLELVNRLYDVAKPDAKTIYRKDRQLHKLLVERSISAIYLDPSIGMILYKVVLAQNYRSLRPYSFS